MNLPFQYSFGIRKIDFFSAWYPWFRTGRAYHRFRLFTIHLRLRGRGA
jgi:hypothetical protein